MKQIIPKRCVQKQIYHALWESSKRFEFSEGEDLRSSVLLEVFEHPTPDALTAFLEKASVGAQLSRHVRRGAREVVVIGRAGVFPGASDVAGLWPILTSGKAAVRRYSPALLASKGLAELGGRADYVPAGYAVEPAPATHSISLASCGQSFQIFLRFRPFCARFALVAPRLDEFELEGCRDGAPDGRTT